MNTQSKWLEVCTDEMEPPKAGENLFANRAAIVDMGQSMAPAEVTVIVQAYNRLEKVRRCVESVLTYTKKIDYELILVDNGSSDGTLDYFQSVPHDKKRIIHITRNISSSFPHLLHRMSDLGRFVCLLSDDLIVTSRWLENLLTVVKSDPKIGMVVGVSGNTSNRQDIGITYRSYEEMQRKAAQHNRSDPRKWEDRQRLITIGPVFRKEALLAAGLPIFDVGFFHDFGDDDLSFQIRRAGYRTVLAGDTWLCHDHDRTKINNPEQYRKSLETGQENFREKYCGVDAWQDVNNFYSPYLGHLPAPKIQDNVHILGVDVRCGTPILDIKNWLRTHNIFDAELSAFVQDPKYWLDLKTICRGSVLCDREEFLSDAFPAEYFDYVVADRPLNRYHEPQKLLNDLFGLCRENGIVICKLRNTFSFQTYVYMLGQQEAFDPEFSYNIPLEAMQNALNQLGTIKAIISLPFPLSREQLQALEALLPDEFPKDRRDALLQRMICREYLLMTQKNPAHQK